MPARPTIDPKLRRTADPMCGLADLLSAAFDDRTEASPSGTSQVDVVARLIGFEVKRRKPVSIEVPAGPLVVTAHEPKVDPTPRRAKTAPIPFWRVREIVHVSGTGSDDLDTARELQGSDIRAPGTPRPSTPPLLPTTRLLRAVDRMMAMQRPTTRLDIRELVARAARREPILELPFERRVGMPNRVLLIVDRARHLIPSHEDQDQLGLCLYKILGSEGLRVWPMDGAPRADEFDQLCERLGGDWARVPVLVASDVGAYTTATDRAAWRRFVLSLERRQRAPVRLLLPCPADRWPEFARSRGQLWDAAPALRGRARARPQAALQLLRWCSFLLYVEPGLLRTLRRALPPGLADVGTEFDAWARVHDQHRHGGTLAPGLRRDLQEQLTRHGMRSADRAAIRHLARVHAAWRGDASPLITNEESLTLYKLLGQEAAGEVLGDPNALTEWLRSLLRAVRDRSRHSERLTAWLHRLVERRPPGPTSPHDALVRRLQRAVVGGARGGISPSWRVVQTAEGLRVVDEDATDGILAEGVPVATVQGHWLSMHAGGRRLERAHPVDPQIRQVTIETTEQQLVLDRLDELPGVDRLLRRRTDDPRGGSELVCEWGARRHAFVWTPQQHNTRVQAGGWVPVSSEQLRQDLTWADSFGVDEVGLWAEVRVGSTPFRLRWVPGGVFVVGSPESEVGRYDRESQHEVELGGYWLGEDAVTQDVWESVMGENPSYFVSARRPVEQVSFEDCARFLETLNAQRPGLGARLPTEAEWEFGCRAGDERATYAGDLDLLGANNAPVLDGIAWYGGNSGVDFELSNGWDSRHWKEKQYPHERAGTHEVGQKRANGFGLHDMLGNVLEWCGDWYGAYPSGRVVDPRGPEGGSGRVVRGGSWLSYARDVRAAYRSRYDPDNRIYYLGFRLARGPEVSSKERSSGGVGVGRRGTRRRTPTPRKDKGDA